MSYPYTNAISIGGVLPAPQGAVATCGLSPISGEYPLFNVSSPVDASGLEFAIVNIMDATTAGTQTMATGATTVVAKPYDGATTAAAASGNNELFAATDFSNTVTGANSWTGAHAAAKHVGTSTTDLDADDWVNLDWAVVLTGTGGIGDTGWAAFFVHGVPGSVA